MSNISYFPKVTPYPEYNSNPTGIIHTCNVCGKHSTWLFGWMWKYILHKGSSKGDPGWDEVFITCSDECREK